MGKTPVPDGEEHSVRFGFVSFGPCASTKHSFPRSERGGTFSKNGPVWVSTSEARCFVNICPRVHEMEEPFAKVDRFVVSTLLGLGRP